MKQHNPGFINLVNQSKPYIQEISCEDVLEWQQNNKDFLIIDVREDHERQKSYIKDSLHLGKGVIERDIETRIPNKDTDLVLYCGGGYRSALAAYAIQQMGYTNVYSLNGGFTQWCARDLPVINV